MNVLILRLHIPLHLIHKSHFKVRIGVCLFVFSKDTDFVKIQKEDSILNFQQSCGHSVKNSIAIQDVINRSSEVYCCIILDQTISKLAVLK